MGGLRHFPLWLYKGGMEEHHVLLEILRVSDEEALRAGCQRTE